jgi:hypothetical protein
MSRGAAVLSALIFLSQPVLPGSISLDSFFVVQSSTSMTPNSSDSFSSRHIQIYDATQTPSPLSYISVPGVPIAGENNSLMNAVNSASYSVTAATFGSTLSSYGFTGGGSFSDASQLLLGFGPLVTSSLGLDFPSVGSITVTSSFDAQLTSTGPADAAVFQLSYQALGSVSSIRSLLVDIRGVGQATVQQNQIAASGTDYTLEVLSGNGGHDFIRVIGGVITEESIAPGSTLSLPNIGTSGNFVIPLPFASISISGSDFGGGGGKFVIQSIENTFNDGGRSVPFPVYPVPEPSTLILCLSGCVAVLVRLKLKQP